MNITKSETIAGLPALRVRDFFKKNRLDRRAAVKTLHLSEVTAQRFMDELEAQGYLSRTEPEYDGVPHYRLTGKGRTLANASAAKPISRSTAEKRLAELLERVKSINGDDQYAHKVESVVVFGSFLSEKKSLSDLDIAVELVPRLANKEEFNRVRKARIDLAIKRWRTFHNMGEEMYWPQREIHLFLKARSRAISLHEFSEIIEMENLRYRVLLGDKERIMKLIKTGDLG